MRTIAYLFFQVLLACSLLLSITCSRSQDEHVSIKPLTGSQDEEFIIAQIQNTHELIELAEIAEQMGTTETSSRASELKDSQTMALYLFTDFANQKRIRIPNRKENDQAKAMYLLSGEFDEEWNRIIAQRTKQTVELLENYFLHANKDSRRVIADVLTVIQPHTGNLISQDNVASIR